MIEQILQAWAEQIDHEDVVQTLLAKVVDIWDSSCVRELGQSSRAGFQLEGIAYGSRPESCRSCIRREAGEHHFFLVPIYPMSLL